MRSSFHEHILSSDEEADTKKKVTAISDTPLFPLDMQELFKVARTLLKSGLATTVSLLGGNLTGLTCLRFAGKYGDPAELAGISLGFTWSGMMCLGLLISINQGFSVFAARLYGAQKHQELGILLQRNICVITLCMIPLILTLWFAQDVLLAVGLDPDVSISTGTFLVHLIPSLIAVACYDVLKIYLIAQNIFYIQPIILTITGVLHIGWCYLFVARLGMTVSGVGIAKSITDITSFLLMLAFVNYKKATFQSWFAWKRECLEKWISHLKETLLIGANTYVEWISLEASLIMMGILNDRYILAAHGIGMSLLGLFFLLTFGNNNAMGAYFANAVGENSKNKAQKVAAVGISINLIISFTNILIMFIFVDELTGFFTDDETTIEILKKMFSIIILVHIADTCVNHLTSVLRCVGKEAQILRCFILSYTIVMINCEWIFGIVFGYGYIAIWLSIGLGMYLMGGLMAHMLWNLDWDLELKEIAKKMKGHDAKDEGVYIELTER